MVLSEVIVDFEPGASTTRDIRVENRGSDTYYIETAVALVEDPDARPIKKKTFVNPAEAGLLVTPNKMVLSPSEEKQIRFLLTQPQGDAERVYRVSVVPKIGKVELKEDEASGKATGVKILLGYDVLVIVRPKDQKVQLQIERKGKKLFAKNSGNTNVLLWKIRQCKDAQKEDCDEKAGPRIYPGRSAEIELWTDRPTDIYEQVGQRTEVKTY